MSFDIAAALADLKDLLPPEVVVTDPDVTVAYSRDMAMLAPSEQPAAVVHARSTEDVVAVIKTAAQHGVPVHPRGAGSGLAGSSNATRDSIVLSLARMNEILEINTANRYARVQPGVVNLDFRKALEPHGLFYPPDPSSYDWCTLGGNLSTNAGGLCCVKYGVTTDFVMGLEVVLADGEVLRTGRRTVKGVAGYDLARVFVGAEGTLGVITEATLMLRPLPEPPATLVASFTDLYHAGAAVQAIIDAGLVPSLLEIMDGTAIAAVEAKHHMGLDLGTKALLLAQSDSGGDRAEREMAGIERACQDAGASELHRTDDAEEGSMLLFARRQALPALEALKGGSLVDDVAVPRSRMAEFLSGCEQIGVDTDTVIGTCGHAGDGNMHPTICFTPGDDAEYERAKVAFGQILDLGLSMGGTITGEHGVGSIKQDFLAKEIGELGLRVHRQIKQALDPQGILNPGKVF
ncbi:FAD-binding oxidoreductase [Cumulibacter manganitolerans]|uniref:FAD-binding oxidoreductase n=1 Tax=Cumulibacter manganitolerans TaxID=1884992 RepID=UPI00129736CE|nr:FAD-linked oxidase C-terminal domain-containing protein [Cumulibacter manganitolerans]